MFFIGRFLKAMRAQETMKARIWVRARQCVHVPANAKIISLSGVDRDQLPQGHQNAFAPAVDMGKVHAEVVIDPVELGKNRCRPHSEGDRPAKGQQSIKIAGIKCLERIQR